MKAIILLSLSMIVAPNLYIWTASENYATDWHVLTDRITGGLSTANMTMHEGYATFSGNISPTDFRGFAMMLHNCDIEDVDDFSEIVMHFKGDGKKYQMRIRSNYTDEHHYVFNFKTTGEQQKIVMKLNQFHPEYAGVRLKEPFFNHEEIKQVAVYLGNGIKGDFRLDIQSIELQ